MIIFIWGFVWLLMYVYVYNGNVIVRIKEYIRLIYYKFGRLIIDKIIRWGFWGDI